MSFAPTDEQIAALDAFRTKQNVVLEAGAGAGKTSTLKLMAEDRRNRAIYFAFNKAIATDAGKKFPDHVLCRTLHSLAWRSHGSGPTEKRRLNAGRQYGDAAARIAGVTTKTQINDETWLSPKQIGSLAVETVKNYCNGGTLEVETRHVPRRPGMDEPADRRRLAQVVLPAARKVWADLCDVEKGRLPWTHDTYLKLFALANVNMGAKYLFLDEAQDSNGVTLQIVQAQIARGAQVIVVGDRNQAIYGWRGATDSMDAFGGIRRQLTQSFRFGQRVADQANLWLEALDAPLRITGNPAIDSRVQEIDTPDAILTRTNGEAVSKVMEFQRRGIPVDLQGGGADTLAFADAAERLKATGESDHRDLMAFTSWGQVQEYVEQEASGSDLRTAVKLIDTYGTQAIKHAMRNLATWNPEVVVSTAHKAKGQEWHEVQIASDFQEPRPDKETGATTLNREEAMLAYVAVTRAQHVLDRGSLSWIDDYLANRGVEVPVLEQRDAEPSGREAVRAILNAKKVCGAEHSAYLNVTCTLPIHSEEVLHDAGNGLSRWGASMTRQSLSA